MRDALTVWALLSMRLTGACVEPVWAYRWLAWEQLPMALLVPVIPPGCVC